MFQGISEFEVWALEVRGAACQPTKNRKTKQTVPSALEGLGFRVSKGPRPTTSYGSSSVTCSYYEYTPGKL